MFTERKMRGLLAISWLGLVLLSACDEQGDSQEYEGDEPGECSDAADNDGDGLVDCYDEGCMGSPLCQQGADGGAGGTGTSGSTGTGGSPENTGAACQVPADCYPGVDAAAIQGEVQCLDRVTGGYCTHLCQEDADCCMAPGECVEGSAQVCSPSESTGETMCFLSCEAADLVGFSDEQEYCQSEAGPELICRSSGGGQNTRRICVPGNCGIGASCAADADCLSGLSCLLDFQGGYCGVPGCTLHADCPEGSACVREANGQTYCLATCERPSQCTFCRLDGSAPACTAEVEFTEASSLSVCRPAAL